MAGNGKTNGNGHGQAVVAAQSAALPRSVVEAVAKAKGMTVLQLHMKLAETVLAAAEAGDVKAALYARDFTLGRLLRRYSRIRTAKGLHRAILNDLGTGLLTVAEARQLAPFVEQRRALDHDDTMRRLEEVEGEVLVKREVG